MKFDEVILRLPQAAEVPADSPLGRKTETVRSRRLNVSEIIPANGLGRFGLRPTQQTPLDAFTSPETLQQMLGVEGRVNAILVAGRGENEPASVQSSEALQASLHPTLADYGISIHQTDHGYFNITSDRMLLEPAIESAVMKCARRRSSAAGVHLPGELHFGRRWPRKNPVLDRGRRRFYRSAAARAAGESRWAADRTNRRRRNRAELLGRG